MDYNITLLERVQKEYSKKRNSGEIIIKVLLNGHFSVRDKEGRKVH